MLGNNMFAYCNNNPVSYSDPSGTITVKCYDNIPDMISLPWKGVGSGGRRKLIMKRVDLTEQFDEFMKENAEVLANYKNEHGYVEACLFFYHNVNDGGILDIKGQDEWAFKPHTAYYYNGKRLRYDDLGNINFGYVGAELFPIGILCAGAGLNQISKYGFQFGSIFTYFDDPRDQEMIKYGYCLWLEDLFS